jgi:hypothetical protein
MSKRPAKNPKNNPVPASDTHGDDDEPQAPVVLGRQLDSDYEDAPEGSNTRSTVRTLQEQVQTLAQNQSQTETLLERLLTAITELSGATRTSHRSPGRQPATPIYRQDRNTPDSTATDQPSSQRYSKKLSDPASLSDGKDPTFISWRLLIRGKFRTNADHFQDEEDKMLYLFNRTSGDAQKHLEPRYDEDSQTRFVSAKEMLVHLASIYVNPNAVRDARHEYNALLMKQGQPFAEFQTDFLHLAGKAQTPQESLRIDLYDKVTTSLQRGIAPNLRFLTTYSELAADLASLDTELKRIMEREERQRRYRERQSARAPAKPLESSRGSPVTINTPMTTATTSKPFIRARSETPRTEPRRPAPADATVICFNCDKPGHYATVCPEPRKTDLKEIEEGEPYDNQVGEDGSENEEP